MKHADQKQLKEEKVVFGLQFQRDKAHRGHKAWHGGKCMATGAGSWLVSFYLNRGGRLNEQEIGQPLVRDFVQQVSTS